MQRWTIRSSGESRRATGRSRREITFRRKVSIAPASIPFRPTSIRRRRPNPTGDPARGYADPSCAPPLSFPTAGSANRYQCRWNGDGSPAIYNPSERLNVAGNFTWQFDKDNQLFLYGTYDRNQSEFPAWPTQVSSLTTFQQKRAFLLPATSPFYPHDFARAFGIDGSPLNVYWSATELGPQTIAPTTEQWNVVAGMRGTALGWTYNGAFNYSRSDVDQQSTNGYARLPPIGAAPDPEQRRRQSFWPEHACDRRPDVDCKV